MSRSEIFKRYLIFFIGLFVTSFGVAIVTRADMGTPPISSLPYVLSLYFPLSLGEFTIVLNAVLILLQLFILRKDFKLAHFLQIPITLAFGYFIDFSVQLLNNLTPQLYITRLICLLLGCITLGIGIYMEVLADVVMLPGESFVRAVVVTWGKEFGTMKVTFDISMVILAVLCSFLFMRHLEGVREGTVIAAFLVGNVARFMGRQLSFLPEKLFDSVAEVKEISCKDIA